MKQKDKDSLAYLLNVTKDTFLGMSRKLQWSDVDSEILDNFVRSQNSIQEIGNRLLRKTGFAPALDILPAYLIYKAWQRTKVVYSFNRQFVEDMTQTEDSNIYISLIECLPFKDMLFFFPDSIFAKPKDEETAGTYVHIEKHPEALCVLIQNYDRNCNDVSQVFPGVQLWFSIRDGMKVSEIFGTTQYHEWVKSYKQVVCIGQNLSEQEAEERLQAEKATLNAVINLMYYLSTKNADIKETKYHKKAKKVTPASSKTEIPAGNYFEVGNKYAEIVYRHLEEAKKENDAETESEETVETVDDASVSVRKRGKKRRPHARRAHFQHYWVGEGRATREVRWKSDIFVGANRDDQAVVVYDTEKRVQKGKQNPNTSKKKKKK